MVLMSMLLIPMLMFMMMVMMMPRSASLRARMILTTSELATVTLGSVRAAC